MRACRRPTAVAASLAVALTVGLTAARPATAQATAQPVAQAAADVRRPDAPSAAAARVRIAATYRFTRRDAAGLPAEVTVADSAGQLVAQYRLEGECAARAMAVAVLDTDLVLQAETASGPLTLRLDGQNAPAPGPVTGRWWLGDARGVLRGRTR